MSVIDDGYDPEDFDPTQIPDFSAEPDDPVEGKNPSRFGSIMQGLPRSRGSKNKPLPWLDNSNPEVRSWLLVWIIVTLFTFFVTWLLTSWSEDAQLIISAGISFGIGGLVTVILWVESFSEEVGDPRRRRFSNKTTAWVFIGALSVVCWGLLAFFCWSEIGSRFIAYDESYREEWFWNSVYGNYAVTLFSCLCASTALMLASLYFSTGTNKSIPSKRIRTPWTLACLVSVWNLIISSSGNITQNQIYFAEIMAILFVLIGTCVWVHGRSKQSNLMVFLSIVGPLSLTVILFIENSGTIGGDDWLLWHLVAPFMVIMGFWLASSVATISSRKSRVILRNIAYFSLLIVFSYFLFDLEREEWERLSVNETIVAVIWMVILMLIAAKLLQRAHSRYLERPKVKIIKILDRNSDEYKKNRSGTMDLNFRVGMFGETKSGKSSFISAIWSIMRNQLSNEIWWKGVSRLQVKDKKHKKMNLKIPMSTDARPYGDYGEISGWGIGGSENTKERSEGNDTRVTKVIEARTCLETCKELIGPRIPNPEEANFPFITLAVGESEDFLNSQMRILTTSDRKKRAAGESTTSEYRIKLDVRFPARVSIKQRGFFNDKLVKKGDTRVCDIEMEIETLDYPGEVYELALLFIARKIREDRSFVSRYTKLSSNDKVTLLEILNMMNTRDAKREGVKPVLEQENLSPVQLDGVDSTIRQLLGADSMFYMVDIDRLTQPEGGGESGVATFFDVLNVVADSPGNNLSNVQFMLNKSDQLLPRKSSEKAEHRLISPEARPNDWDELTQFEKDSKAREILDNFTNNLSDVVEERNIRVGSMFTCTFGGLLEGENEEEGVPPYPFVPVNAMESFLHLILDSELTPIDM